MNSIDHPHGQELQLVENITATSGYPTGRSKNINKYSGNLILHYAFVSATSVINLICRRKHTYGISCKPYNLCHH